MCVLYGGLRAGQGRVRPPLGEGREYNGTVVFEQAARSQRVGEGPGGTGRDREGPGGTRQQQEGLAAPRAPRISITSILTLSWRPHQDYAMHRAPVGGKGGKKRGRVVDLGVLGYPPHRR